MNKIVCAFQNTDAITLPDDANGSIFGSFGRELPTSMHSADCRLEPYFIHGDRPNEKILIEAKQLQTTLLFLINLRNELIIQHHFAICQNDCVRFSDVF